MHRAAAGGGNAAAQDWFKTGTGLGVTKARVAVPEFAVRSAQAHGAGENVSRRAVERPGILRAAGNGEPELLSHANAEPAERSECRGVGGCAGERVHAGVRQTWRSTGRVLPRRDIYRTCTIRVRRSRCKKFIAARRRMRTRASWRTSSRTISSRVLSGGLAGHRADADCVREHAKRQQGNLGNGLRRRGTSIRLTHLKSISLTPRWSPDATRIAFTCYVPYPRNHVAANLHVFAPLPTG